jgi:DNA-binding CsgD family transcriptional regulator/PAS domain-containing protein
MLAPEEEDDVVTRFYAAATGIVAWEETLGCLAECFHSTATLLGIHRPGSMDVLAIRSHNYSKSFLADFFQGEIYANDPRMPPIGRVPGGAVYHDAMLYDLDEIERDPWVRASIEALGVADQMGAKLRLPGSGFATLGLLRTRRQGRVTSETVAAFSRLVPRIEQACALGYVVEEAAVTRDALLEVLAERAEGLALIDRRGRISYLNRAAERCLQAADGLVLRGAALRARRPPEARRLNRLVSEAVSASGGGGGGGGRMLVSRGNGGQPYLVTVTPAPRHEAFLTGAAVACVVRIEDLAAPRVPEAESLRAIFGLSGREAALAVELVRTGRLDDAAAGCGISVNTARNHLQSIFGKTGVNCQARVVQLLGRLA